MGGVPNEISSYILFFCELGPIHNICAYIILLLLVIMGMDTSDKDLQCFGRYIKLWVKYINRKWHLIYVDYVMQKFLKFNKIKYFSR